GGLRVAAVPARGGGEGPLFAGAAGCAMSSVRRRHDPEDGRYRPVNVGRGQGDLASSVLGGGEGLRLGYRRIIHRRDGDAHGGRCRPCPVTVLCPVGQAGAAVPVLFRSEGQLVPADGGRAVGRIRRGDDLEDSRSRRVDVGRGQGDLSSEERRGGKGCRLGYRRIVHRRDGDTHGGRRRP